MESRCSGKRSRRRAATGLRPRTMVEGEQLRMQAAGIAAGGAGIGRAAVQHDDLMALPREEQRRRESDDAGADDHGSGLRHVASGDAHRAR